MFWMIILRCCQYAALNVRITDDLERNGCGPINILSQNLPVRTERNHEKLVSIISVHRNFSIQVH